MNKSSCLSWRWKLIATLAAAIGLGVIHGCADLGRRLSFAPITDDRDRKAPTNAYQELVAHLDEADIELQAKLRAGALPIDDQVTLSIPSNQVLHLRADVDDGRVVQASLRFAEPIEARYDNWLSMRFQRVNVDHDGRVHPVDLQAVDPLHRALVGPLMDDVRSAISSRVVINRDVYRLLQGDVLALDPGLAGDGTLAHSPLPPGSPVSMSVMGGPAASVADASELTPTSLIDSIDLRVTDATLEVGAVLRLAEYEREIFTERTRIVVDQDSGFDIDFAHIEPGSGTFDVVMDVRLNVLDSSLSTAGENLHLAAGSKLILNDMELSVAKDGWSFASKEGYASLQVADGGLSVEGWDADIAEGSSLELYDFVLSSQTGRPLSVGGAGRVRLGIDDGLVYFNGVHVDVGEGMTLDAEAKVSQVEADEGYEWRLEGIVHQLRVPIDDADVSLGAAGRVRAGSGSEIVARDIRINTAESVNFTGRIDRFAIEPLEGRLNIPTLGYVLFGDGSSMQLRQAEFASADGSIHGVLDADLRAVDGRITFGDGNVIGVAQGSNLLANGLELDSEQPIWLHGPLDLLSLTTTAATLRPIHGLQLELAPGSRAKISEARIHPGEPRVEGVLKLSADAYTGRVEAMPGLDARLTKGTRLRANQLRVDTAADNPVYGSIAELVAVASGVHLTMDGRLDVDLSGKGVLEASSIEWGASGDAVKADLKLAASAFAGRVDLSQDGAWIRIDEGTSLRADRLRLDTSRPRQVSGKIDKLTFETRRGTLQLPGASRLTEIAGTLELALEVPDSGSSFSGQGRADVKYSKGRWDHGIFSLQLQDGTLATDLAWTASRSGVATKASNVSLMGNFAARGGDAETPPYFVTEAPGVAFEVVDGEVRGVLGRTKLDSASGQIAIEGAKDIVSKARLDREKLRELLDSKKPNTDDIVTLAIVVESGWRMRGQVDYSGGAPSGYLLNALDKPIKVRVEHSSLNDGKRRANLHHWADGGCKLEMWWNAQTIPVTIDHVSADLRGGALSLGVSGSIPENSIDVDADLHGYWYCDFAGWMFSLEQIIERAVRGGATRAVNEALDDLSFEID